MIDVDDVAKFFDAYSRTARLFPALIAIGPILLGLMLAFPKAASPSGPMLAVVLLSIAAVLYLSSTIVQWRGKSIEPQLIAKWGGWPTTVLLRHSDSRIDSYTKARYHAALDEMCNDLTLPDLEEETADPADADAKYRSATKRLIESRRNSEYALLHRENAKYGFRRNMLGIKPIAIILALVMAIGFLVSWLLRFGAACKDLATARLLVTAHSQALAASLLLLGVCAGWLIVVRPSFVKSASLEYAEALLRTLDSE